MLKEWINDILIYTGIMSIITALWQLAELKIYGHTMPSNIDSIVALILTTSLFFNIKSWGNKER